MKNVIVIGLNGHSEVVLDCLEKENKYNIKGFVLTHNCQSKTPTNLKILGGVEDLPKILEKDSSCVGIVAIPDNWQRHICVEKIKKRIPDFEFITTVHPEAVLGKNVSIGIGSIILAGAIVNSNSTVKDFCILNTNCSLDHDGLMQDYSSLGTRVSVGGNFTLGNYSAVCVAANIIGNIEIGNHTVVAAGSLVIKNVQSEIVSFGIPAEKVRTREIGEPYLDNKGYCLSSLISKNINEKLIWMQ